MLDVKPAVDREAVEDRLRGGRTDTGESRPDQVRSLNMAGALRPSARDSGSQGIGRIGSSSLFRQRRQKGGIVTEQDEPENQPDAPEDEELLRARHRRLGKKLRSRGLIVGEADEPLDEPVEEDSLGS